MTWSDERILNFIEMYRCRPVLWDIRLADHKDREKRHAALVELAVLFGVTKEEVERKIKNLLSHYSREVKKEELGSTCPDFKYRSKWFCFASLQFLRERHSKPNGTDSSNVDFRNTGSAGIKTEEDLDATVVVDESEFDPLGDHSLSPSTHPVNAHSVEVYMSPDQSYHQEQRRSCNSTAEDDALVLLREISSLRQEKDEYSLFGEQVAIKIRKLASPYARMMVQHIINTTLFEAEMGKYDNPASVSSTLPTYIHATKESSLQSTSKRQRLE